jgi:hypothetical protein
MFACLATFGRRIPEATVYFPFPLPEFAIDFTGVRHTFFQPLPESDIHFFSHYRSQTYILPELAVYNSLQPPDENQDLETYT